MMAKAYGGVRARPADTSNHVLDVDSLEGRGELRYPTQEFVEWAVADYFRNLGFSPTSRKDDLFQFEHKGNGTCWVVGVVGGTKESETQLTNVLGHLIRGMTSVGWIYGLALPSLGRERKLVLSIRKWVRVNLGLHWLVIGRKGGIKEVLPDRGL